jgi:hypothetical protein
VWFWSSTQYQTSQAFIFQGLLFLSGLLFVVQEFTLAKVTFQVLGSVTAIVPFQTLSNQYLVSLICGVILAFSLAR